MMVMMIMMMMMSDKDDDANLRGENENVISIGMEMATEMRGWW